jgi:hypothetical protein
LAWHACGIRIFIRGNQDIARPALLRLPELRGIGYVIVRHRCSLTTMPAYLRCQHKILGANLLA